MSNTEKFLIKNLSDFTNKIRVIVFNSFGTDTDLSKDLLDIDISQKDELDSILSYDESLLIVKQYVNKEQNKINKKIRYSIQDNIFYDLINALNQRMISNILNSLVKKGLVESAFDSKSNDFIFWIKNDDTQKYPSDTT